MKTSWRGELVHWALLAAMFLLAALSWRWAPNPMPVHWDVAGQVDRYGSKVEGLLVTPLVTLGVYLLLRFVPQIDPGRANYFAFTGAYATIRLATTTFLAIIYGLIHLWIRGHEADMATVVPLLMGGLYIVLGNLMGKIRPNWFVGFRTPWTLSSKAAWVRTHRIGGRLFIISGLMLLLAGALGVRWAIGAGVGLALASAVVTCVYSYFVWRRDPNKIPPAGTEPVL